MPVDIRHFKRLIANCIIRANLDYAMLFTNMFFKVIRKKEPMIKLRDDIFSH